MDPVACVYPMTSTHPKGSFLIRGLMNEFVNGMSAGFSSFIHFAKFLHTKTMSLVTQSTSVKLASKALFPRSSLLASKSSASWSLML